ncbi:MAG TPA: SDR family oxidoreductase [Leeuwenhoekiella sp.]|nr:SDR family oxidoreductase [Leeuwenhoekiella sp.]
MEKEFNKNNGENQWALILGGSSGLGLASAKKLAAHGLHVYIVHRTRRSKLAAFEAEKEKLIALGSKVHDFNGDALNAKKWEEILSFLKKENAQVKVLLHSLAKGNLKPVFSKENTEKTLTATDFSLTIEAMATSLYSWSKALVDNDLFSPQARILSFTSMGSRKPLPNYAAVSAAKAALEAITRSLAYELAPLGITANCIQAGVTDTESLQLIPGSKRLKEEALAMNPNKRLTTPEDVAAVVYLLVKPESSWINGTIIPVDGGEHMT